RWLRRRKTCKPDPSASHPAPLRGIGPRIHARVRRSSRGERAFESGPIGRPAVRREHVLDRQREQRAQSLDHLFPRHALAQPLEWDLETTAEVDERVAGNYRAT